jgi:hypothetical protein
MEFCYYPRRYHVTVRKYTLFDWVLRFSHHWMNNNTTTTTDHNRNRLLWGLRYFWQRHFYDTIVPLLVVLVIVFMARFETAITTVAPWR